MQKTDKDGILTKEYIDFVTELEREDLERFYMGADLLNDDLQLRIDKAIEYIENIKEERKGLTVEEYIDKWKNILMYYDSWAIITDLLEILEGEESKEKHGNFNN